jgi:hypothetical protein
MRRRRDIWGSTLRFPMGDTIFQDNAGGLIVKNRLGRVVKTVDRYEREFQFDWNSAGELVRVWTPGEVKYVKLEDENQWIKIYPDQTIERTERDFQVLPDGALRTAFSTISGARYYRDLYLDGSSAVVSEHGRIRELQADLEVQRERLYTTLDALHRERRINYEQRQGVCDAFHALLRRVALEELSESQAAQTVFHICRLLESCGTSPLGAQICYMLSHEIMFFAALPDEAPSSDGLSALIRHLYRMCPEQVALLVADMSINHSYTTISGYSIKYVDELMHPISRRMKEWTVTDTDRRFVESNRFLRVVLVNVTSRMIAERESARESNVADINSARSRQRSLSTREFGRVQTRELSQLFQEVTGVSGAHLTFETARDTEAPARSKECSKGHNSTVVA